MNKAILHTAIDLLSRREHSIKEITRKLLQREYERDEIDSVIVFLLDNNYLCERRYTESVIRKRVNKGYGKHYIYQELKQNGIERYLADEVAENLEIDWYHLAQRTYSKRFGATEIADQKEKAKRIRFLQYRGFSSDEIMSAIEIN